jgi:hypothetical protein
MAGGSPRTAASRSWRQLTGASGISAKLAAEIADPRDPGRVVHLVPDTLRARILATQKEALHYLVKVPLVYTNVAISNWQSFVNLGVSKIYCPGSFHSSVRLNPVTNICSYRAPRSPDEPI